MKEILRASACFLTFIMFCCQNKVTIFLNENELNKKSIYLVYRGTNTKEGFFARDFNIHDTLSSHVGISLYETDNWKVYHVLNSKNRTNDLIQDKLLDFFDKTNEKLKYASIWEIINLNSNDNISLKTNISEYAKYTIKFDRSFSTTNDSTQLYCSELIFNILHKTNPEKFNFKIQRKKLKPIYSRYLRRDTLQYYPVDLFQLNENIKLIKEWIFIDE